MKPWANQIRQHIDDWSNRLQTSQRRIPENVYHFTAIPNAVSILSCGKIYSRHEALRLGLMETDNACPDVIGNTRVEHKQFARFYFRPRTPTQFNNEGIRPQAKRSLSSHCPTPVFFCFDAFEVLSMDDVEVSDGNMGTNRVRHSSNQDFFESIPFEHVFHFGPYDKRDNRLAEAIKFHRHAEVLVPEALPIGPSLRHILVRSPAEASTLLGLLPAKVRKKWEPLTKVGEHNYFNREATFVETVSVVDSDRIKFEFNPSTKFPGPFEVDFSYQEGPKKWSLKSTKDFTKSK